MEKLLSISIAAYNVEKTIQKCLDSFLTSKYLDELELLVINDGSYDHTPVIVNEYKRKYPGIVQLINKENGGHGSTINTSLQLATGKFYKVIDGDDWVDAAELDKLMSCLKNTNAELIINDYMEVYPDHTRRVSHRSQYQENRVYKFDEIVPDGNFRENIFAMHESTILTKRLLDEHMIIQEKCFYADTEFLYYVGRGAQTIEFNDSCVYQYRLGNPEQSVSAEGIYKHIEDFLKIEYHLIQLYHEDEPRIQSLVRRNYLFAIIDTRYNALYDCFLLFIQKEDKDKLFVRFIHKVKHDYPDIVSRFYLSRSNHIVSFYPEVMIRWMRILKKTRLFNIIKKIK